MSKTYADVTHIEPFSQGQTCQSGRLVVKSGNRYIVRKVWRDQSLGPEWHDNGQLCHLHTKRAIVSRTWHGAMMASAY